MDCDIAIIGAGIAGLSAACAVSGVKDYSSILIEGRGVGSNNPSPLTFADIIDEFDLVDCCRETYDSFVFHNWKGSSIAHRLGREALIVLDYKKACAKLAERAVKRGTSTVLMERFVTGISEGENLVTIRLDDDTHIRSRILIDASGSSQVIASRSKKDGVSYYSHVYGGSFANVGPIPYKLCCFLLPNPSFGTGGGWFYSLGQGRASFGYATISSDPGPDFGALRENFERARSTFEPYSKYLANAHLEYSESGVIPISHAKRFVRHNVIVVGDAAGMATNWTCMGIEPSLRYGRLAGEMAVLALSRNDPPVLNTFQSLWEEANKDSFDRAAKNLAGFWSSDHYFWEWIIKNDLAFLTPAQLLDRLRWNRHLLKKHQILYRALRHRTRLVFHRGAHRAHHFVVTE